MEQKQPNVSVIIPAYHAENYVRQAIASVLEQTYPELIEILIIDDASTDKTEDAVKEIAPSAAGGVFLAGNRFLQYYRNTENRGVAFTRNFGVSQAKGDYIAFLDADDWWAPEKLEKQMQVIGQKTEDYCFCFTGRELMDLSGKSLQKVIPVPQTITYQDMLKTNYVTCSSVLMKRELALANPMDHDEYCEDYICWMRILKEHGQAAGIREPLVKYRMVTGSKSNNKKKAASDHYHSLRIIGISPLRAAVYMISYVYNGIKKYS